jgi:hypothetical protein
MVARRALVQIDGELAELPAADSLLVVGASLLATVDFALTGASATPFVVAFPGVTLSMKILASISMNMPANVDADELELEPLYVSAFVSAVDQVTVLVGSQSDDPLFGSFNINLVVV